MLQHKISRRHFIQQGGFSAFSVALLASIGGGYTSAFADTLTSWKTQFQKKLADHPWLYIFHSVDNDYFEAAEAIEITGEIPPTLNGTLYRNGPALHEMGSMRYHHLFDGDGMVQSYHINNGGVGHLARMVQTTKLAKERVAGRRLFSGFGTAIADSQRITSPDDINVANISMLHHHGKLFALWEGGSAYEINEKDLTTVSPYVLADGLEGYPFNPHPRVEADGSLWNVGYSLGNPGLLLYHIDAAGQLIKHRFFAVQNIAYLHDFLVTKRYLIVPLSPLRFQSFADNVVDSYHWQADEAMTVLVFDKHHFERVATFELPAQFIFHYGNAYEDENGLIHYDAFSYDNANVIQQGLSDIMRGETMSLQQNSVSSRHTVVTIDIDNKTIREQSLSRAAHVINEFPTIDTRLVGQPYQWVVSVEAKQQSERFPFFNAVVRRDVSNGHSERYQYSEYEVAEEHLYVSDNNQPPEVGGWIVGTTINFREKRNYLNIFEANQLAQGPIARARLPYGLPVTFHGKFVDNHQRVL